MKAFRYRIAGRTHGVINQTNYDGQVHAETPKEAILIALAANFGDRGSWHPTGSRPPFEALTETGWIDKDVLHEQFSALEDSDSNFELEGDENTFVIEVNEVEENAQAGKETSHVPHESGWGRFRDPDCVAPGYNTTLTEKERAEAEEWIAALIFDRDDVTDAKLSADILYGILRRFRPDLFSDDVKPVLLI
jgi:hypothetical protein